MTVSLQVRDLPKVSLIQSPTPLHPLPHLSAELGIDLWIKRDDLTGFAFGGNKGRKLEYMVADALAQGADAVVTCGSMQSNFIRQLAAACSMHGLRCAAAVMILPFSAQVPPPAAPPMSKHGGNVLLDELLGVDLRAFENDVWEELYQRGEELAREYEARGLKVYRIPIGGSCALGAYAFYQAGQELERQTETDFDWIVFASSSGSTQTGLGYAFNGRETKVLGIACDPEPDLVDDFERLAGGLDELLGESKAMRAADFRFNLDYVGPGYGVPSEAGNAALRELARKEGVFLDPVYSSKAFSGLLDLARKGELKGRVLFWHTGGLPNLFAMPEG